MTSMERWLPVPGKEGFYEVSDRGRVRSLTRTSRYRQRSRIVERIFHGKVLRPDIDKDGYWIYRLSAGPGKRTVKGHRLVMMAFVGPCPSGMEVSHLDGDPGNNQLSNLRYMTTKENHSYKWRHGTMARGSRHGRAVLSEEDVIFLRKNGAEDVSKYAKAKGCSETTVLRAMRGETWSWL